jgi:hypothetical protein
VNGPSIARIARTLLEGWLAHKDHEDPRVRERIARESRDLPTLYAGALWASERWAARRSAALARIRATRERLAAAFGLRARIAGPLIGSLLLAALWREERRLARGATCEPRTFYEANPAAWPEARSHGATLCRWMEAGDGGRFADTARPDQQGLLSGRRGYRTFDLHPDGRRVAVLKAPAAEAKRDHLTLVLGFADELRRIAPPR